MSCYVRKMRLNYLPFQDGPINTPAVRRRPPFRKRNLARRHQRAGHVDGRGGGRMRERSALAAAWAGRSLQGVPNSFFVSSLSRSSSGSGAAGASFFFDGSLVKRFERSRSYSSYSAAVAPGTLRRTSSRLCGFGGSIANPPYLLSVLSVLSALSV